MIDANSSISAGTSKLCATALVVLLVTARARGAATDAGNATAAATAPPAILADADAASLLAHGGDHNADAVVTLLQLKAEACGVHGAAFDRSFAQAARLLRNHAGVRLVTATVNSTATRELAHALGARALPALRVWRRGDGDSGIQRYRRECGREPDGGDCRRVGDA